MAKIWLIFNGLDVLTTHFALRVGAIEANPVLGSLNSAVGEAAGYVLKLFLAVVVVFIVYKMRRVSLFRWLNTGMGIIVVCNVVVLVYCLVG